MKAKLEKVLGMVSDLQSEADEKAGSDNEKTAERYQAISDALNDCISNLEEAIAQFDI